MRIMRLFRKRNRPPKVMRYIDLTKLKPLEFKINVNGIMQWLVLKPEMKR